MKKFRFSLCWLLGAIALLAVFCAAIKGGTRIWLQVAFTCALVAILTSIMGAIWSIGGKRAFCIGFGTFGAIYLLLALGPFLGNYTSSLLPSGIATNLLLDPTTYPPNSAINVGGNRSISPQPYIVHVAFALLFAFLGGLIGSFMYSRSNK